MRRAIFILVIGSAAAALPLRAQHNPDGILARVVMHKDGSRTETIRTPEARTVETIRRAADGAMISREKSQLNAVGNPVVSLIYDAQGGLLSRTDHVYDQMGRKAGERTFNRKGRKIRDVVYTYDQNGKANKPIARNYADPDTQREPAAPMAPVLTPAGRVTQPPPAKIRPPKK